MMLHRHLAVFAALNGAMAVALGAFAAHGAGPAIKTLLTTGAQYQIVHAVLALVCAVWPSRDRLVVTAGWLAGCGGLIFSLALAFVAVMSISAMGMVAPIGGALMIAAWLLLAYAAFRSQSINA